jgi:tetratricopeptide (TPR) repeat protein
LQERLASPLLNPLQYNEDERRDHNQRVKLSLEAAERRFERVLEAVPAKADARLHLGRVVDLLGRPVDARAHYLATLATSPPPDVAWLAHMWLGRQSEKTGDVDEAIEHYRAAAAIFPGQSTSVALAHAFERSGRRDAAREQLRSLTPPPGAFAPACGDGCDPFQQYDLVDRGRVAAQVKELIRQACEAR